MPFCRLLPHGLYSLIPTVLATVALIAGHARDACQFARLTKGPLVDTILGSADAAAASQHYLKVGLNAYRLPDSLKISGMNPRYCIRYDQNIVTIDPIWHVAKAASFISIVLGGGAVFYLWISICCRFNKASWRCAAYEILLAMAFQMIAFSWFGSEICKENKCEMDVGSKSDVAAVVIWFVAAVSILVHFPKPSEITLGDGLMASNDLELNVVNDNEQDTVAAAAAAAESEAPKKDGAADAIKTMTTGEDSRQEGRKGMDNEQLT